LDEETYFVDRALMLRYFKI